MKPCNIISRLLIMAQLSESNNYNPDLKCANISYMCVLFHSSQLLLSFWYINHKKIKGKECIHVTIHIILCLNCILAFLMYFTISFLQGIIDCDTNFKLKIKLLSTTLSYQLESTIFKRKPPYYSISIFYILIFFILQGNFMRE